MNRQLPRFQSALLILYFSGVFVLALQPLRTLVATGYEGVFYKGGDESQYIMRIRDAMTRPWTDVSNSIVTGPEAPRGLQMTLPEMLAGALMRGFQFSAPGAAVLLSVLLAPLVMPLLALLAVRLGSTRRQALAIALLFFILLFGPLRRVVHQSWSLPFVIGTLVLMADWWREPTRTRTAALGVLLGLVPGIYFWSWTFLWAAFGFTAILGIGTRLRHREQPLARDLARQTLAAGIIALVTAVPFFVIMWLNAGHPEAADASARSSLIHARELESVTRSVLYLFFTTLTALALMRHPERRRTLPLLAVVLALLAVLHQQFVHGLVLSYWTHYYPYVCMAAVLTVGVLLSARRALLQNAAILLACLFLFGAFVDYKGRMTFLQPVPHYRQYQHLVKPIELLRAETEKQTVLTDRDVSLIVGTYTDHDVVFTAFMRHTLVSFRELSDRYCLTEIVRDGAPDTEWLARDVEERSAAGVPATQKLLLEHAAITEQACGWVAAKPLEALRQYRVTRLLWDERNHPDWQINPKLFEPVAKGAGWSLWVVR